MDYDKKSPSAADPRPRLVFERRGSTLDEVEETFRDPARYGRYAGRSLDDQKRSCVAALVSLVEQGLKCLKPRAPFF